MGIKIQILPDVSKVSEDFRGHNAIIQVKGYSVFSYGYSVPRFISNLKVKKPQIMLA